MNFTDLTHEEKITALEKLPKKQVILFACECARLVLPIWEKAFLDDQRPLKAIEAAENQALNNTVANATVRADDASAARAADAAWTAVWAADATSTAAYAADAAAYAADADSEIEVKINHLYNNMILNPEHH